MLFDRLSTLLLLLALGAGLGVAQERANPGAEITRTNSTQREESLAIIVHPSNNLPGLSLDELRKMFQGRRSQWPSGRKIAVFMLESGVERSSVLQQIYQMGETEYDRYFRHSEFTGEVVKEPRALPSAALMKKYVSLISTAIGYTRASELDPNVKVLRIDGHLPDDPDYPLKVAVR